MQGSTGSRFLLKYLFGGMVFCFQNWSDLLCEKVRKISFHSTFTDFQTGHLKLGIILENKMFQKNGHQNFL